MRTDTGRRQPRPTGRVSGDDEVPASSAGQFRPVATLDFSAFGALNAAKPAVVPAPSQPSLAAAVATPPTATYAQHAEYQRPERSGDGAVGATPSADPGDAHLLHVDPFDDLGLSQDELDSEQVPRDRRAPGDDLFVDLDFDFEPEDQDGPLVSGQQARRVSGRRRSRVTVLSRRVLGLDRPGRPRQGRPPRGGEDDPAWLTGLDQPAPPVRDHNPKARRRRRVPAEAPVTTPGPARRSRPAAELEGVEVTAAPRGFAAVLWLWVARVALVVIFLAGVNQVFVKPFRTAKSVAAAVSLDVAASQQAAARFVSDYLTYLPGRGAAQLAALQNDVAGPAGAPAAAQWSGTGFLRADSVLPGQVVAVDPTHSLVSVAALVHTAMPAAKRPQDQAPAKVQLVGADPGSVPTGWTDLGGRWVQLTVPVQATGAGIRVSGEGAVFSGEVPQLVAEPAGAQVDQGVTTATQPAGAALLAAYASSNLSYLAAPGVSLEGLNGAVSLVSLTGWSVSLPPGGGTAGAGTGLVTWQLAGTDLHIAQPYAVALTNSQGRWYGAALSPDPATQ